ncbi:MAG: c-type cytochrome [Nitrospinae bacterium]|nr:c-type cytochrome [Nitrospinota bacterium]
MKALKLVIGLLMFALFILTGISSSIAADGKAVVDAKKCGSCHKMQGPAVKTIAEVLKRQSPDLFYAGSKFKEAWLVGFLQNPTIIRPAGTVYVNHIKTGEKKDEIVDVKPCAAKLSKDEAEAVAKYLMTLKEPSMKTGVIVDENFSKAKAKILFTQKEACHGCHRIKADEGGVSCPTLYNAGARLNPDWIYDFIKDPMKYDPKIWMPKRDLSDEDFILLSKFIASMKE